jgi:hypothetical protein
MSSGTAFVPKPDAGLGVKSARSDRSKDGLTPASQLGRQYAITFWVQRNFLLMKKDPPLVIPAQRPRVLK